MRTPFPNLAKSLPAIEEFAHNARSRDSIKFFRLLHNKLESLSKKHPYEPVLHNYLNCISKQEFFENKSTFTEHLISKSRKYGRSVHHALEQAVWSGTTRLPAGGVVATREKHELVTRILTSKESIRKKISVNFVGGFENEFFPSKGRLTLFGEPAARQSLKNADLVLLGCTVITPHHIVGGMGCELMAELAKTAGIPVYVAGIGMQYDPFWEKNIRKLEGFSPRENTVSYIRKHSAKYEFIEPKLVKGILSELGSTSHNIFVEEVKSTYPWIFD